jgi:hypothetical protein
MLGVAHAGDLILIMDRNAKKSPRDGGPKLRSVHPQNQAVAPGMRIPTWVIAAVVANIPASAR